MDIRIGANGNTYTNAGNAVRENDTIIKNGYTRSINNIKEFSYVSNSTHDNKLLSATMIDGKYRNYQTGTLIDHVSYRCYDHISIKPSTTYLLGYGGVTYGYHIVFFDNEGAVIPGVNKAQAANGQNILSTIYYDTIKITTPANAVEMSYSLLNSFAENACLIEMASQQNKYLFDRFPNKIIGNIKISSYNEFCPDAVYKGCYVGYASGNIAYNASFCYEVIPVEPNTYYSMGGYSSVHYSEYNSDGQWITGINVAYPTTVKTSSTTTYIAISVSISSLSTTYFCKGKTGAFSKYGSGDVYKFYNYLEVGSDKQFKTIQSAVDVASDYDTILIYPGTYNEAVDARSKFLKIIGIDKKYCILTHPDSYYTDPPLEIAKGYVSNITIHTSNVPVQDSSSSAYTTHIDFNESINTTLTFENVYFHSEKTTTIGIGLRNEFTLEFINCHFKNDNIGPAFYCHDDPIDRSSKNQILVLKNCTFENNSDLQQTILLQTMEFVGAEAKLIAQSNIVKNHGNKGTLHMVFWNPSIGGSGYLNSNDWSLSDISGLNNIQDLNT